MRSDFFIQIRHEIFPHGFAAVAQPFRDFRICLISWSGVAGFNKKSIGLLESVNVIPGAVMDRAVVVEDDGADSFEL